MEKMTLENPDIKKCIFSASIAQLVSAICLFICGCVALGFAYGAGSNIEFPINCGAGLWCSLFAIISGPIGIAAAGKDADIEDEKTKAKKLLLVQFAFCIIGFFTSGVCITIYVVIILWCIGEPVAEWCMPNTAQNLDVSYACVGLSFLMFLSCLMSVVLWIMLQRNIKQEDAEKTAQKKKILAEALGSSSPYGR